MKLKSANGAKNWGRGAGPVEKSKKRTASPAPEDFTSRAYLGIRQMMFSNELVPNEKMSYSRLAKRLGMSPTPVIQALNQLELQGLVRRMPNKGYYTEPITMQQIEEIYDLEEVIEISLVPKILMRLDEKGIRRLRSALQNHLASVSQESLDREALADAEFHLTLVSLSYCYTQQRIIRYLYDLLYLKYRAGILFSQPMTSMGQEHQEIFDGIILRDLEKTTQALSMHISHVKQHVLGSLSKNIAQEEENGKSILESRINWMDFEYKAS